MWEYRVLWAKAPPWWETAWEAGCALLPKPEERPDRYLILPARDDIGIKLRNEKEDEIDVKVLHERRGGWELWEKVTFFRWNSLEAIRFGALLGVAPPPRTCQEGDSPGAGVRLFLKETGIDLRDVTVEKTRLQTSTADLFPTLGDRLAPGWLAELAEIRVPGRNGLVYSACVEAMAPLRGRVEPIPAAGGLVAGYPELLRRPARDPLEESPPSPSGPTPPEGLEKYLLAEQERLGEALYRNEEVGERRVQFFTGLVTSVYGGLAFLATAEKGAFAGHPALVLPVVFAGSAFLLVLGLLTYDRVLRRDQVRDQYKQALDAIRECFLRPVLLGSPAPALIHESVQAIRNVGAGAPRQRDLGRLGRLVLFLNTLIAGSVGASGFVLCSEWPGDVPSPPRIVAAVMLSVLAAGLGQAGWWRERYGCSSSG